MSWAWLLLPLIGAVIGWITNSVAVRMLFRPRRAWRVPFTQLRIQGLLPRRQAELAHIIGQTVEKDLMSTDTLLLRIQSSGYRENVMETVNRHVHERLNGSLPRFIPQPVVNMVTTYVAEVTQRETGQLLDRIEGGVSDTIRNQLNVAEIVEEKMLEFDLDGLERLVVRVAARELRHIEWLGGILGFLIGIVQALIVHIL